MLHWCPIVARHGAFLGLIGWLTADCLAAEPAAIDQRVEFSDVYTQAINLDAGETVEISVGVDSPSRLPANGRLVAHWSGPIADAGFRKVLHALDPDLYVLYCAPRKGQYALSLRTIGNEEATDSVPRWRETGVLAKSRSF